MWFFYDRIDSNGRDQRVLHSTVSSMFFPQEMQRLLRQHGFNIEEMYGDFAPGKCVLIASPLSLYAPRKARLNMRYRLLALSCLFRG